ncbi:hypothetical protein SSTU70S_03877 [Stutzerimonas stutzeri]
MAEVGNDLVDAVFHAVEVLERGVTADDLVGEDPRQPRVGEGVNQLGLANGHQQPLGGGGVGPRVLLAQIEVFLQRVFFLAGRFESLLEVTENAHDFTSVDALNLALSSGIPEPGRKGGQWSSPEHLMVET